MGCLTMKQKLRLPRWQIGILAVLLCCVLAVQAAHEETTTTYPNGDTFTGEFKKGKRYDGTLEFANGDRFTGDFFRNGWMHTGTLCNNADRNIFKGTMFKDKPYGGIMQS